MIAVAVIFLETFCCFGLGAAALRGLRLDGDMTRGEHWTLSFAVGFGILGWLMFPLGIAGLIGPLALTALLSAGSVGALLLPRPGGLSFAGLDRIGGLLAAIIGVVLVFNLMEGVAPPADADSLAYHFTIPRQFVEAGRVFFVPMPLEGAVPLLVQMTYVPALGLGGELALTMWTMASGWAAAALLFVLCRRHLGINWSLALTVVFLTTPAVIYGSGSGQVETRIALFVMTAAWAASRALQTGRADYAVLAGIGAGFFAAAKYTGLLFVAITGLLILMQRGWLRMGICFAIAALVAGFQWYAWNVAHTGDPVFPMLFQWLGRDDLAFWGKAHDLVFKKSYFAVENPLPHTLLSLITLPFMAIGNFSGLPDAGRVGFGPYGLLLAPFVVLGLWKFRDRVQRSPLFVYALLAGLFYVLWFYFGGSQRIRHLVPVLPLVLICATVAAERVTAAGGGRAPLQAAMVVTVSLQLAGHGLFSINYFKFLAHGADREAFLMRNVNVYVAVPWLNANLGSGDRVLIQQRQLRYFLKVPYLYGTPLYLTSVDLLKRDIDASTLYAQLRKAGVTHLLLSVEKGPAGAVYGPPFEVLDRAGCLKKIKQFEANSVQSRTLPALAANRDLHDVVRLESGTCRR